MARTYVSEVSSNIKRGVNAKLTPKTLILGPKGSGKTSIVQSVELATTGTASDVMGRGVLKADADLWSLSPKGAEAISAKVKFDSGEESSWALTHGKRSKLNTSLKSSPFVLRDVRDAFLGSPEKARKFLLDSLGTSAFDWRASLPTQLRTEFKDQIESLSLTEALEGAKRRTRELTADSSEHDRLIKQLGSSLNLGGTISKKDKGQLESELKAIELLSQTRTEEIGTLKTELDGLPTPPDASWLEMVKSIGQTIKIQLDHHNPSCLVCGSSAEVEPIQKRYDTLRAKAGEALQLGKKRSNLESQISQLQDRLERDEYQIKSIRLELQSVENDPSTKTWEAIKKHQDQSLSSKRLADRYSELVDALKIGLKTSVEKAQTQFEGLVSKFIPEKEKFRIELNDGDREIFRFGLTDPDGHLRAALSKGEEAMVFSAITMALTYGKETPIIINPPEAGWDPQSLVEVLGRFTNFDGQVLVTSTVAPKYVPQGWSVIELDGKKKVEVEVKSEVKVVGKSEKKERCCPHGTPLSDLCSKCF
jgi:energy-coupling factor transporter ATP-binding protein EcfA2